MALMLADGAQLQDGCQVLHRPALGPRARAPRRALHEPDVAAVAHELGLHALGQRGDVRQAPRGNERIVDGVDQQRRPPDPPEVRPAAGARPVIHLVGETVQRRRDGAVVGGERARLQRGLEVDEAGIDQRLGPGLVVERPHEARRVHGLLEALVHHAGALREIEGHRDGHGRPQRLGHAVALLAQPLEQHVAADREADGPHAHLRLALDDGAEYTVEVARVAGVVEAGQPVQLTAARAKPQDPRAPAARAGALEQAGHVVRAAGALEPVEHEEHRRARTTGEPVEVDEVAVRCDQALARHARERPAPDDGPQRLQVAVAAPPRCGVGRSRYSWPVIRSFTISGTISRARWSSCASVRLAMGCGMARYLYFGWPHCSAMARPVLSKTSVMIDTEGLPCFSSRIPSSTLPDEHDPQSPMPATTRSAHASISATISGWAGTLALCYRNKCTAV